MKYQIGQQVVRVNGENGARMYQMGQNSSALLLDENEPLVWLVQTDGAGYKTLTPYKIEPYVKEPDPDLKTLLARIEKLEGVLYESNIAEDEPAKQKQRHAKTYNAES